MAGRIEQPDTNSQIAALERRIRHLERKPAAAPQYTIDQFSPRAFSNLTGPAEFYLGRRIGQAFWAQFWTRAGFTQTFYWYWRAQPVSDDIGTYAVTGDAHYIKPGVANEWVGGADVIVMPNPNDEYRIWLEFYLDGVALQSLYESVTLIQPASPQDDTF